MRLRQLIDAVLPDLLTEQVRRNHHEVIQELQDEVRSLRSDVDSLGSGDDHGELDGLSDDDHTQYLRTDGTRDGTSNQRFKGGTLFLGTAGDNSKDVAAIAETGDLALEVPGAGGRVERFRLSGSHLQSLPTLLPRSSSEGLGDGNNPWNNVHTAGAAFRALEFDSSAPYAFGGGDHFFVCADSGPNTITLPSSPSRPQVAWILNVQTDSGGSDLTVSRAGSDAIWTTADASATSITLSRGESCCLVYRPADSTWYRFV